MEPGSVLFLENLFEEEREKKAEKEFAEELSKLGDIYVNEAFSLSGTPLASNTEIVDYFERENIFAGLNFGNEYANMLKLTSPDNLFTLCLNNDNDLTGSLAAIENMVDRIDSVILMGELSSTVFNF